MTYKTTSSVNIRPMHDGWSIFGPTYPGVPPPVVVPYMVPAAYPRYGIRDSAFYGFGGCGPGCTCEPCQGAAMQGLGSFVGFLRGMDPPTKYDVATAGAVGIAIGVVVGAIGMHLFMRPK